jgi:hypothetical protein
MKRKTHKQTKKMSTMDLIKMPGINPAPWTSSKCRELTQIRAKEKQFLFPLQT